MALDTGRMIELPDFAPLRATATDAAPTRAAFDRLDHVLVVTTRGQAPALARLPYGKHLAALLKRTPKSGDDFASSHAANARATGLTVATFRAEPGFTALTWAAKAVLGIAVFGITEHAERAAAESLVAAASAAAFALPAFKSKPQTPPRLASVRLFTARSGIDLSTVHAQAFGNNLARWFTALPSNVLTVAAYRRAIEALAKARGMSTRFYGERELTKQES